MFVRILTLALCLSAPFLAVAGNGNDKIQASKFCQLKKANNIRYCYLKATSRSVSGDVVAYSEVIEVDLTRWNKQKIGEIFSFEESLSAEYPSQTFIASYSWLSETFVSKEEAYATRDAERHGLRNAAVQNGKLFNVKH